MACVCLPVWPGIEVEVGEVGAPCGADGASGPMGVHAVEVDRGGAEDVGQAGLGLASVAAGANPDGADALGDGALDAGTLGVPLFPGIGLLLGTLPLEEIVFLTRVQSQASGEACGARGADLAAAAVPLGEDDDRARLPVHAAVAPVAALGPGGTDRILLVPVDLEVGEREALGLAGLPVAGGRERPDQVDTLSPGGQDDCGGGVAAVDQVLARRKSSAVQVIVHRLDLGGIVHRC